MSDVTEAQAREALEWLGNYTEFFPNKYRDYVPLLRRYITESAERERALRAEIERLRKLLVCECGAPMTLRCAGNCERDE